MDQLSFASLDFAAKKKRTKRDVFLAEMAAVVPWGALEAVIEPHYEVDPVSWTPDLLGRRSSRCRSEEHPTHLSSAVRWSSWRVPAGRRRSFAASSGRPHNRSATGSPGLTVTRAAAPTA